MLYQLATASISADAAVQRFWKHFEGEPDSQEYANAAVRGVVATKEALDARIQEASTHWRIERMAKVDLAILRLGTWELEHAPGTGVSAPRAVVLDEAVELAKSFGSDDSPAFINGVLNRVADLVEQKNKGS